MQKVKREEQRKKSVDNSRENQDQTEKNQTSASGSHTSVDSHLLQSHLYLEVQQMSGAA